MFEAFRGDTATDWVYTGLIVLIALQRLAELRLTVDNRRWLEARGAYEVGAGHYPFMVVLHAAFLVSCVAEVHVLDRPFIPALGISMLALMVAAAALRVWAIRTLGRRWTTRVFVLPGAPPVAAGPYRYVSHPNYLAVVVEIFALPLLHTAVWTAIVFSLANAVLLAVRLAVESRALDEMAGGAP
jgi:methyltransferase